MTNFAYTILYVRNVKESIDFYTAAFGFEKKLLTPENDYGEVETGSTILSFASIDLAQSNLPDGFLKSNRENLPFGIEIGFTTNEVEETVQSAIQAGAIVVGKPKTKPWGQTVAYVRDPDGFLIEICTPMS